MSRTLKLKLVIVAGLFIAFTGMYKLLQKPAVYEATLSHLTMNYERVDSNKTSFVREVNKPYAKFIEENANNWDAEHYKNIRDHLYAGSGELVIYRYAFYPLFPLIWKLSHTNVHGIVVINYLFFGISLILLSSMFLKDSKTELFYYVLALLLPSAAVFYLPYTESLFLLCFSLAFLGLVKKKYWLFFLAMLCLSMTRPSALLLCFVFIVTNTISLISHKQFKRYLKECFFTTAPILMGWGLVTWIQYLYSDSWSTYFHATNLWPKEPDLYKRVVDWSIEGFGMNGFALFALAVPACIAVIIRGNRILFEKQEEGTTYLFGGDAGQVHQYMFNLSLIFISGFTLFNLLASGYQWNGFHRYTMATPFFYIIFFQLPGKLKNIPVHFKISAFFMMLFSIGLFLMSTEYAGDIWRFKYLGLYLLLIITLLILFEPILNKRMKLILIALLILPCLIWHTFVFNMFLGNAWLVM